MRPIIGVIALASVASYALRRRAGRGAAAPGSTVMKLVPYALRGQLGPANLATALVLTPLAAFGMALGLWLHQRVDPATLCRLRSSSPR